MIPNCTITLYNKYIDATTRSEQYQRASISDVVQWGAKGIDQSKDGQMMDNTKSFQVRFSQVKNYIDPVAWKALTTLTRPNYLTFQEGDYIVIGAVTDEITGSFSIGNLKDKYPDVVMVTAINSEDQGNLSMRHWEINAK